MKDFLQKTLDDLGLPTMNPETAEVVARCVSSLILLIVVYVIYLAVARALNVVQKRKGVPQELLRPLKRIARWVAFMVAVFLVLQKFQVLENAWSTITALLAMVAIGFVAVWSVLSNMLCSLVLMVNRPFRVGDRIALVGHDIGGEVWDFNLLFTVLRDGNDEIRVPNNLFFQAPIRRSLKHRSAARDAARKKNVKTLPDDVDPDTIQRHD